MTKLYLVLAECRECRYGNIIELADCVRGIFKSREGAERFIKEEEEKGEIVLETEISEVECDFLK